MRKEKKIVMYLYGLFTSKTHLTFRKLLLNKQPAPVIDNYSKTVIKIEPYTHHSHSGFTSLSVKLDPPKTTAKKKERTVEKLHQRQNSAIFF